MRSLSWWLVSSLALVALGCGGNHTSSPVAPGTPDNAPSASIPGSISGQGALGSAYVAGDNTQSALAIYTVDLDPTTLSATSHLKETRAAQQNDDLYLLSIDSFLNASSFRITGVSATVDTIDLGYVVAHPFPAPSTPTGTPNGSTNRADLGVAGMVLVLADAPTTGNTYFTDRVANTELVANADAYYSPAGLLTVTGTANTFPYKQLVDETGATGSRVGISNSGSVTGNFGSDGWTRAEFGAGNDGWTGYGVLHQGQVSANTLSFNRTALSSGLSLDVAIIAKYNDPRGGANAAAKKLNRLPPATADSTKFAYRMPHGALDVSKIEWAGETGGFYPNQVSASTLYFRIDDWDARATETTAADLSEDASFNTVAVGESGTPTVDVCIPGVLGDATATASVGTILDDDTAWGGDAAQDSGAPGDGLFYCESVSKTVTSGQSDGTYTGFVRATDAGTEVIIPLNADTLLPLTANPPTPATYQAFTVDMIIPNEAPTATITVPATLNSGCNLSIAIDGLDDLDLDTVDVSVDWTNTNTFVPVGTFNSPYAANIPASSPSPYTYSGPGTDTRTITVRLTDAFADFDFPYNVDISAPFVAANYAGNNTSGSIAWTGQYIWYTGVNGSNYSMSDITSWNRTSIGATPVSAGFLFQAANGTAPSNPSNNLIWFGYLTAAQAQGAPNLFLVTDLGASYTRKMQQIEAGTDGRVFWSNMKPAWNNSTINITPMDVYDSTIGADVDIHYVDYTGTAITPAGVVDLSTGTNRVVAMSMDEANNVYYLDTTHVLHKLVKANSYAEDTACPWPMDLSSIIGTNTGAADDTNRKVADFVVDFRSKSFIFLVVSQGPTAPGNMYLYRVENNGTFNASLEGNPNPRNFNGNFSTNQTSVYDVSIDQFNTAGNVLATQGQAQLIVSSYPNYVVNPYIYNTNLVLGAQGGTIVDAGQHTVSMLDHGFAFHFQSFGFFADLPGTYPTGWPTNWQ